MLRGVLDLRGRAVREQLPGRLDERLSGPRLLLCPAGRLIWDCHYHDGTVIPWYWRPITPAEARARCIMSDQDPVVTDPELYTVVFENERVRVLQYRDRPGDRTHPHHHPDSVMVTPAAAVDADIASTP